jgi:hypothetical protein
MQLDYLSMGQRLLVVVELKDHKELQGLKDHKE